MKKRDETLRIWTGPRGRIVLFREGAVEPLQGDVGDIVQAAANECRSVLTVASPENAALLDAFWKVASATGKPESIRLSAVAPNTEGFKRLATLPRSLGGVREMTEVDGITYALGSLLAGSDPDAERKIAATLRTHPGWPATAMSSTHSVRHAAISVLRIGDPRWHVDARQPDESKRLMNLFGLGADALANVVGAIRDKVSSKKASRYCADLMRAWMGDGVSADWWTEDFRDRLIGSDAYWGTLGAHLVSQSAPEIRAIGALNGLRAYLLVLAASWTDFAHFSPTLTDLRSGKRRQGPELFVPSAWFDQLALIRWNKLAQEWRSIAASQGG